MPDSSNRQHWIRWIIMAGGGVGLCLISCAFHPDARYGRPAPQGTERWQKSRVQDDQGAITLRVDDNRLMRFQELIQSYWRAPYRWGGTSPEGIDCSGLVYTLYNQALDLKLPRSTLQLYAKGRMIGRRQLSFADLVFFNLQNSARPDHVGIYIARGYFLHASVTQGVSLSSLHDRPYLDRYLGARRYFDQ